MGAAKMRKGTSRKVARIAIAAAVAVAAAVVVWGGALALTSEITWA